MEAPSTVKAALVDFVEMGFVIVPVEIKDLVVASIKETYQQEVKVTEWPSGNFFHISKSV